MNDPIFAVYAGPSMNPTLVEPGLMEIIPYAGERSICPGDVILFHPPGQASATVHRVMRVNTNGITTRGDNNPNEDAVVISFGNITGRVAALQRGGQRTIIHGGRRGLAWHYFLRGWRVFSRCANRLLHVPYQALVNVGIFRKLIPARWQPRVVVFQNTRVILLGSRVVGRYDARRGVWQIQRPFRLFCSAEDVERNNPS